MHRPAGSRYARYVIGIILAQTACGRMGAGARLGMGCRTLCYQTAARVYVLAIQNWILLVLDPRSLVQVATLPVTKISRRLSLNWLTLGKIEKGTRAPFDNKIDTTPLAKRAALLHTRYKISNQEVKNNGAGALIDRATFYVVKNSTRNLLGKETAIKLGLGVNAIDGNQMLVEETCCAESTIGVGEEVYVKKVDKVNKLSSPFYEVPHTVVTKNGNDVEIENDDTGQRLRRYIVHLKRVEG
ncbi:Uncharacterized protein OBRU01_20904 [Operophtera brumata]|uniref:Uncharacterized protein n=1 Tax=Operophtera brumata TaxID=104452 RepID=A0A0L7KUB2_OPEBR|nr:Uncharacterized protein OBRU01_20904 [Operophtera brumata]